jgi:hypothetical protein
MHTILEHVFKADAFFNLLDFTHKGSGKSSAQICRHASYSEPHAIANCLLEPENETALDFLALSITNP